MLLRPSSLILYLVICSSSHPLVLSLHIPHASLATSYCVMPCLLNPNSLTPSQHLSAGPPLTTADDDLALKSLGNHLPKKPRRYYVVFLVACLVQRLESFHRTTFDLQCATAGIEAFLPLIVLLYELLPGRRARTDPRVGPDHDDILDSNFDYVKDLARESKVSLVIATVFLSWGTYIATYPSLRSTFFCSSLLDDPTVLLASQWAGVVLDGIIAILLWRVLAWARTTRSRLRTLSGILFSSALGTSLMYFALGRFYNYAPMSYSFRGLDSLFVFDIFIDGIVFSVFLISASFVICESTPLNLASIITASAGILAACERLGTLGTWENVAPGGTLGAVWLLCTGISVFVYANNLRAVVFIPRALLVGCLVVLLSVSVVLTALKGSGDVVFHPLSTLIYDTRIEADRWLVHASVSKTLRVACDEYRNRHDGRNPPPKYDIWYQHAVFDNSAIIDHFPQIARDLAHFWGVPPAKIREDVLRAAREPDMATLRVEGGQATHNLPPGSPHAAALDGLVGLVEPFAKHLPDMVLPINLNERPRVLVPWDDLRRLEQAAKRKGLKKLLARAEVPPGEALPDVPRAASHEDVDTTAAVANYTSVKALREMTALTCPHDAPARSGVHWDVRDFCATCARPQSRGQYLTDWDLAQDVCHQPDLLRLHSYYMTSPDVRPLQDLLPVFGRTKTASHNDILIPLPRPDENREGESGPSNMKWKKLYWRQDVTRSPPEFTHELWRGGQRERLMHLLRNDTGRIPILLPTGDEDRFRHEVVLTSELNAVLPLDVGFGRYVGCDGSANADPDCDLLLAEFGSEPEATELGHMYVLAVDGDHGPSPDLQHYLRSTSTPLVASIFREWYTERLRPWLHFVPIDLRYHALHSTLAYFTGLHGSVGGRDPSMGDAAADSIWIAEQGKRWAERALRREDMQIYLFRLLLEWGRLIDDRRDELGYVFKEE
ncbi:glycosyltransferase family 90 protein [Thozetella sp. PMI_491]|nr:glycosyltransferase family 90 protein [Thozetella sp. PMI_491]